MRSYAHAVALLLAFLVIAHLAVGEPYLWYRNSLSQLAAQAYPNAWIMRTGFVGFGILVMITSIHRMQGMGWRRWRELGILLYGLAILLSGVFSTSPFLERVPYSVREAQLHSLCATGAGIGLSIAILLFALSDEPASRRWAHGVALVAVTGLSLLLGALPEVAGAVQRLLWVAGLAWLVYLRRPASTG